MDEYLFIEMAKLKADQRRLELERRETERLHRAQSDAESKGAPPPTHEFVPLLNWR